MSPDIDRFNIELDSFIDSNMKDVIADLQDLIRQPSVSARHEGLDECAHLVCSIMRKAGISAEILHLNDQSGANMKSKLENGISIRNNLILHSQNGKKHFNRSQLDSDIDIIPPIVFGEVKSKSNPGGKTILFYNHYDVQPEEPVDLWDNADPFSGKVDGSIIFGRGSSDDKGELITRIKAVEFYLKKYGDVPCDIKFVVEGEEEIGSPHIDQYISIYRRKLDCDYVIWEFGYINEHGIPILSLGMKGLLYVEMKCKTLARDAHSSLAAILDNPAWMLIRALNTIRDESGKILVKNWYKEVRNFTPREKLLISLESFDEEEFKRHYGIKSLLNDVRGDEIRKALVGQATCNLAGLAAGYLDDVPSNIVPGAAIAKIDFRLVPDMDPEIQFNKLIQHLDQNGFKGIISTKFIHGVRAARTDPSHHFVKQVRESVVEIYGNAIISVSSAGTGPMYSFYEGLKSPCVSFGCTYVYARIHSPNEFARLDFLNKSIKCLTRLMNKVSTRIG
ncbi:MAG TPA: M20/M25/M40 family metallo-hydrolase [Nitrososphaeraceae archaeon]